MGFSRQLLLVLFRAYTGAVFRIDDAQLARVPEHGPLILVTNHVNLLELPIIYSHLQPRRLHGLALAARWKNPVLAWGLTACESIPLERGGINMDALRKAFELLQQKHLLLIAPEGTRSYHGRLQDGHPGIIPLALKSGAPLLPIGYYGGENYLQNMKHLKRTDFHLAVGKPFRLDAHGEALTHDVRTRMVDEIMYQLASILPEAYRGKYTDMTKKTENYLVYKEAAA
ncbi:MAG TPA: lysophospholipid acyltransferase family protein [Longilinea sp.]|nr:lysophospholipid acyltransferase family protein [Longilinea sp.]